jgi:malate synthase
MPPVDGVDVLGPMGERFDVVLTSEALAFVAVLQRALGPRREELLHRRKVREQQLLAGEMLDFLPETRQIREGAWQVAAPAAGLVDRRVEITGPTDRKMTINALNSGAKVWLADFEDASSPIWENQVGGQLNLLDALDRRIDFTSAEGKAYHLLPNDLLPTIVVRPRGWHLLEKHLLVDGAAVSASLFDFGLHVFHGAKRHLAHGRGPYFYLAKLESHLEARLWNDAFVIAEDALGLERGTIRATVLIETIPAAFEMEEILYELREHSAGLNAGRWDYMFSIIKKFRASGPRFVLPDRNSVTMTVPFMRAYTTLLVQTCHRRRAHAIGGMAAFIPNRRDPEGSNYALAKVLDDKQREARDGFDGSWVAHPDLVPVCREVFDAKLGGRKNQLDVVPAGTVTAADLLAIQQTPGTVTEAGLRNDISVGIQYLQAWLGGNGAVAIFNLMEDAATAEIARSQIWQWLHNGTKLNDGRIVTLDLVRSVIDEEVTKLGDPTRYAKARKIFEQVATAEDFADFLTVPAYACLP